MIRALLLILAVVGAAHAQFVGDCLGVRLWKDGVYQGCITDLDTPSADFNPTITGGYGSLPLAGSITRMGALLGDELPACSGTWSTTSGDMSCIASWKPPLATTPTTDGVCGWNSTANEWVCGDGTNTLYYGYELHDYGVGFSSQSTGDFTYNGEATANCTGNVCRGGTCTNNAPPGNTCTLTANSFYGQSLVSAPNNFAGGGTTQPSAMTAANWALSYGSVTMTAGTLTIGTPDARGATVTIRATGNISLTGGTINLAQKGTNGHTGGTVVANTAGKGAGCTVLMCGPNSGAAGGANNGAVGFSAFAPASIYTGFAPFARLLQFQGAGGGGTPTSTATLAYDVAIYAPSLGAEGGSGPGCPTGTPTGITGPAGNGGGGLKLESYRTITLGASMVIDLRGGNGGITASGTCTGNGTPWACCTAANIGAQCPNGGSGGGGGSLGLFARAVSNSMAKETTTALPTACPSGKICTRGGSAAGTYNAGITCGAPQKGGDGDVYTFTLPL